MDDYGPRGASEVRSIFEDEIEQRTKCDSTCTFHHLCPLVKYSSGGKRCPAQNLNEDDMRRLINLYFMGEEGLKQEVLSSIFQLSRILDLKGNPKDIAQYVDTAIRATRTYYNDKSTKAPSTNGIDVNISMVKGRPENSPLVEVVGQKGVYIDPRAEDPESLMNSSIVDEIVASRRFRDED